MHGNHSCTFVVESWKATFKAVVLHNNTNPITLGLFFFSLFEF